MTGFIILFIFNFEGELLIFPNITFSTKNDCYQKMFEKKALRNHHNEGCLIFKPSHTAPRSNNKK